MATKVRIKDIAEMAGVSVGTVDRVLHKRPNVSSDALKRVEEALEKLDYTPNAYASALATNKKCRIFVLIPKHNSEAYWQEIEEGAKRAQATHSDFNLQVEFVYYTRTDEESFYEKGSYIFDNNPDGVVLVPGTPEITARFAKELHRLNIPFTMLDSYLPDLKPLAFFGQDSFASGEFAAKMLMLHAHNDHKIGMVNLTYDGFTQSRQSENREVGFRQYLRDYYPRVAIEQLNLPYNATEKQYHTLLDAFFRKHPDIHHLAIFNSRAYVVGEYLLHRNIRDVQIMGYDMVPKNRVCLNQGSISFIIAQYGYRQGYLCVDALFRAIVLKMQVEAVNYMPIGFLTKENSKYYKREEI